MIPISGVADSDVAPVSCVHASVVASGMTPTPDVAAASGAAAPGVAPVPGVADSDVVSLLFFFFFYLGSSYIANKKRAHKSRSLFLVWLLLYSEFQNFI